MQKRLIQLAELKQLWDEEKVIHILAGIGLAPAWGEPEEFIATNKAAIQAEAEVQTVALKKQNRNSDDVALMRHVVATLSSKKPMDDWELEIG